MQRLLRNIVGETNGVNRLFNRLFGALGQFRSSELRAFRPPVEQVVQNFFRRTNRLVDDKLSAARRPYRQGNHLRIAETVGKILIVGADQIVYPGQSFDDDRRFVAAGQLADGLHHLLQLSEQAHGLLQVSVAFFKEGFVVRPRLVTFGQPFFRRFQTAHVIIDEHVRRQVKIYEIRVGAFVRRHVVKHQLQILKGIENVKVFVAGADYRSFGRIVQRFQIAVYRFHKAFAVEPAGAFQPLGKQHLHFFRRRQFERINV